MACNRISLAALSILIAFGVAVRVLTVSDTPADWLDNVQVAEISRPIVSGGAWSANLLPDTTEGNGSWAFYWLGSAIQSSAYGICGRSGARLAGVAIFIVATILAWRLAGMLGAFVAFSFAPIVQSVCYGRVDVVAIAFVLAGLAIKECKRAGIGWAQDFLVGLCAACAIMSWFTAIFALPVLTPRSVKGAAMAGLGFMVAMLVLWVPFYGCIPDMVGRFRVVCESFAGMPGGMAVKLRAFCGELLSLYGLLIAICAVVLFYGRRWFLLAMMLGFALVCLTKRAYVFRSVYFLPYVIVALAGLKDVRSDRFGIVAKVGCAVLSLMMYAQTVCLWGARAWITSGDRDYGAVEAVMAKEVGRDVGIFLDTYQLYYVGRDLGWRQYCTWCAERKGMDAVLAREDIGYYIGNGSEPDDATRRMLDGAGFEFERILVPVEELEWDRMHLWRLGPYNLWKKRR